MVDYTQLPEDKNLLNMLEFETQIFLDILHKDGLVIVAKGLSTDVVLMNMLKVYLDPGNLVLVLNCAEFEEKYLIDKLNNDHVHSTTCNTDTTEREDVYLSGGIHFVTTRILVVDMLKNRIPIDKITGIIVLRAHNVLESCQEAFVLRLYRQKNKTGFIKGFSNSPQSFTVGFNHVERIMRTLFVKELYIWPRFHSTVIESFKKYEPQIIELHVPASSTMLKLQTCILDLMNLTVKELKRINKMLEMQDVTVENCISKNFHKLLQNQLEGMWHQFSPKSKQLMADLKTLQHLITTMLYSDPVTFYSMLLECRTMEYAQTSTWVLLQPADLLFEHAQELIFNKKKELNPEFCPKWNVLSEILRVEIPAEIKQTQSNSNKVLILCQDKRSCYQLKKYLTRGAHYCVFLTVLQKGIKFTSINKEFGKCRYLQQTFSQPSDHSKSSRQTKYKKPSAKIDKKVEKEEDTSEKSAENDPDVCDLKEQYVLAMTQSKENSKRDDESEDYTFEPCEEMEDMDLTRLSDQMDLAILIQTYKSDNYLLLQKVLEDVEPNYIIMYHSNITAIRQIELYEARRRKTHPLKIYYLVHAGTVEEQNYLTSLRREKEAFEFLIEIRSTMVVSEDQDGKVEDCLIPKKEIAAEVGSTRRGGKPANNEPKQLIIVDMREFRSELPALLHKRGIDIEPVTITVGDYILTPDICVERKSLSDLVGSLSSGRLYQQCTQMSRYYGKPMLLIEFDQNRPFSWQNNYIVSSDGNSFDIQQKLLLLTLHFRKLKIIWSASPYASVQLFEELKKMLEKHVCKTCLKLNDSVTEITKKVRCCYNITSNITVNRTFSTLMLGYLEIRTYLTNSVVNLDSMIRKIHKKRYMPFIQHGKDQPSLEHASAIGSEEDLDDLQTKYNANIYDFVQKLPGITSKNIDTFLRRVGNLNNAINKSKEELKEILGNAGDVNSLYSTIHEEHMPKENVEVNGKLKFTKSTSKVG